MKKATAIVLGGSLALSTFFAGVAVVLHRAANETSTQVGQPYVKQSQVVQQKVDQMCGLSESAGYAECLHSRRNNQDAVNAAVNITASNQEFFKWINGAFSGTFLLGVGLMGLQGRRENKQEKERAAAQFTPLGYGAS